MTDQTKIEWTDPAEYEIGMDLVLVLCVVTMPETENFPLACEMPCSSGDHAVGDTFVSIGHANVEGDWFVAGWDMMQDCWTDARCFAVTGFRPLPQVSPHD